MSVFEISSTPTHRSLMKKSKDTLASELLGWLQFCGRQTETLEKLWKVAKAAKDFIECHVGDPDINDKMKENYARYQAAMKELGAHKHVWDSIHTEIKKEINR